MLKQGASGSMTSAKKQELGMAGRGAHVAEPGSAGEQPIEEPAWLALPAVHYVVFNGGLQPSFKIAIGQPNTNTWLAWEVGLPLVQF